MRTNSSVWYTSTPYETPNLYERVYTLCDKHCVILVWGPDYQQPACRFRSRAEQEQNEIQLRIKEHQTKKGNQHTQVTGMDGRSNETLAGDQDWIVVGRGGYGSKMDTVEGIPPKEA